MQTHVRCGTVFTGGSTSEALADHTICFDERGEITHVGPTSEAPPAASDDAVLDYSRLFVMPGLHDVHTHLAYGNAKTEEDIDLYQPMEFRALRGLFFAQKVLAAGYTSICAPGDAGQISLSVRNAINFGLFDGPRVTAAGRYITSRQGLTDWYPTWIGAPDTSIGRLVTSRTRRSRRSACRSRTASTASRSPWTASRRRPDGELIAAFNQDETDAMVHARRTASAARWSSHARGREAIALFGARRRRPDLPRLLPRRRMHRRDGRSPAARSVRP